MLWGAVSHPNILKLIGVHEDLPNRRLTTVMEWMERGTIMDFIGKNRVNKLELVRDSPSLVAPSTTIRR